jgi:adenylate cyclase
MILRLKEKLVNLFKKFFTPTSLKVGLLITLLNVFFQIRHYMLPKNAIDLVGQMETKLYDIRFKTRGQRPMGGLVGSLSADDKSIERFGRWPFRRDIYDEILKNLKNAGVKWIGFDVLFSEPSRRSLEETVSDLQKLFNDKIQLLNLSIDDFDTILNNFIKKSPDDISLGKSIESFGNVVQSFYFSESKKQILNSNYDWEQSFLRVKNSAIEFVDLPKDKTLDDFKKTIGFGVVTNIPLVWRGSNLMGFANNQSDSDGLIRKYLLVKTIQPTGKYGQKLSDSILVPSLALSLASHYLNAVPVVHFDINGVDSIILTPQDSDKEPINIPIYFDGTGRMLVNHYGEFNNIPQISLEDAFDNKLPKHIPEILIYGGTGTGTNDKRPSPFDENFNGVGFHIAALNNILTQNFMTRSTYAPFIELAVLLLSGILFSIVLNYMGSIYSAIFILTSVIIFYFVDQFLLFGKGKWFYVGTFYVQSLAIYISITLFKYFTEESEKRMVKGAFQRYLNPSVINKIIENPGLLKLGGEKKLLTVFFSDVRGFTSISEQLSPEKLTSVLNEYFTPMTKLVLDSGGLLDKYIGDAMMAVWGAPVHLDNHADRALESSLLMLDQLKILQQKWESEGLPHLDIGIGLNTGEMVVGNMGSDQRFDYTVLGDSVNLGSRLESINKNYGTRIICSEFTVASLKNPELFLLRELDIIRVKGKSEPVKIYEVMQYTESNKESIKKLIQYFHEGLSLYRLAKWDEAIVMFKKVFLINEFDGPAMEFIDRCAFLKNETFSDEKPWQGIWTFKTK